MDVLLPVHARRLWVPPAFSPLSLSPLFWFRNESIAGLNDGDQIQTYPDSSGNGQDATQATAAQRPTKQTVSGRAVDRTDTVDDLFGTAQSAALNPFTFMAVLSIASFAAANRLIIAASATGGIQLRSDITTGAITLTKQNVATIGTSTTALVAGTPAAICVTYDTSGNYAFYIDGVAAGSGTNLQTFAASVMVLSVFMGGDVWERILFGSVLSAPQIASMSDYFRKRHGTP